MVLAIAGSAPALALQSAGPCTAEFQPVFGAAPGTTGPVRSLAVFDAGDGPRLYIGGKFSGLGPDKARGIAYWDGESWRQPGPYLYPEELANAQVTALLTLDLGGGPRLYVGGSWGSAGPAGVSGLAAFDGSTYQSLGSTSAVCFALERYQLAGQTHLAVAGNVSTSGGPISGLGLFDGAQWTNLNWNLLSNIEALAVVEPGSGAPAGLYVGHQQGVSRYVGTTNQGFVPGLIGRVLDLEVYRNAAGFNRLYAAGTFTPNGLSDLSGLAVLSGSAWQDVVGPVDGFVHAVHVQAGTGQQPEVTILGDFAAWAGQPVRDLARANGSTITELGGGVTVGDANSTGGNGDLLPFDDGSGTGLIVAGDILAFASSDYRHLSRLQGQYWRPLGDGLPAPLDQVLTWDRGQGPELVLPGGQDAFLPLNRRVRLWDGSSLTELPNSTYQTWRGGTIADLGAGPELVAVINSAHSVVRYSATGWDSIGLVEGVAGATAFGQMQMLTYDSGQGPELYITGLFTAVGGVRARCIARWNGQSWQPLSQSSGEGLSWAGTALAVFDGGQGPRLIVAGEFAEAGGLQARQIASWDGSQFAPLGGGLDGEVLTLAVHDDGSGQALYAAGAFISADGIPVEKIARWNGTQWSSVGAGIPGTGQVLKLISSVGPSGQPRLYAFGTFTLASGAPGDGLLAWDGTAWLPTDATELQREDVTGVELASIGNLPPSLYFSGAFQSSPSGDSYLARYGCAGPGEVTNLPGCLGNALTLSSHKALLQLGAFAKLQMTGPAATGLGVLYVGAPFVDSQGCGLPLPGIGELLLDLNAPLLSLLTKPTNAGVTKFEFFLVNNANLVGVPFALAGLQVNGSDSTIKLSNALKASLQP
jgi:hypothetical protein